MNAIEIHLSDPFDKLRATVLALPAGQANAADHDFSHEDVEQAIRRLYEAAHGRLVETPIGPIAIAPAVSASLKAAPFSVRSRAEFIALARTKISLEQAYDEPRFRRDLNSNQQHENHPHR